MHAAEGILTTRGGMTSHAAVVARGMGKPCVSGAGSIRVDYAKKTLTVGSAMTLKQGDIITVDGSTGQVLAGRVPMIEPELSGEFATLMGWADKVRKLGVRANADTPADARTALKFGAEGIGLCRTEHMFFDEDRILRRARDDPRRRGEGAPRGARENSADAAQRLRRTVRDHEGAAGHDPSARSAAARIPAAWRGGDRRSREGAWAPIRRSSPIARASLPNSIRCSASAAAASRSPIRKSPRCRRARFSRPRSRPASAPASRWCRK